MWRALFCAQRFQGMATCTSALCLGCGEVPKKWTEGILPLSHRKEVLSLWKDMLKFKLEKRAGWVDMDRVISDFYAYNKILSLLYSVLVVVSSN